MHEIRADIELLVVITKAFYPKIKNRIKVIFTSILLTPVWIALVLGVLSYSGFCFEKHRFLSDEEKIRIGVADLLKTNREHAELHHDPSILHPWHTVDEFLAANPGCCEVVGVSGGGVMAWLDKLFGYDAGYVLVVLKDDSQASGKWKYLVRITSCGKAVWS